MLKKVIRAIKEYEMLENTGGVTVALSGGADSVALLYALCDLRESLSLKLDAIHINHRLRAEESLRDENFVRRLCESLQIPLKIFSVDVMGRVAETGESIELAARNIRYEVFEREAEGVVATAHTASDNLETVLFNMSRGTGIKGLCGIPPKRDKFIRPLIFCTRKEVETYLSGRGAEFVIDSTNLSDEYTRNHIRLNTVPTLKGVNPSVEHTVSVMCTNLREDEDFIFSTAQKIYTLCLKNDRLDAELLRIQHTAIIKRVINLYLNEFCNLSADSIRLETCKELLEREGRTQLCGSLFAFCKDGFFFAKKEDEGAKSNFFVEQRVKALEKNIKINNLFLQNTIDCDKIYGSLTIRTRNASDEIRLRGRNCTKSLKKLMNELKIPQELRDSLPVAADELGVVWIYGIGVSERVAVDDNTEKVVEFAVNKFD